MEKLLLLDGHSILSRAFYGIPDLTTAAGVHTGAVYGFLNIMLKCIDDEHADYIAVAFDLDRKKLKRTALYPEYKGTRKPMPTELLEQVPTMQGVLKAMNIPILTLEGYEADDILGTIAKKSQSEGIDVTIVSGDRDLLQLCDKNIKVSIPKTSKGRTEVFNYYPEDVLKEYQVTPEQFIEVKALQGDTSDNIPGLPGVGPKTATAIILQYGSIEAAHEHAAELKPAKAQKAMLESYELAVLSKRLATIDLAVPIEADVRSGRTDGIYTNEAFTLMRELELKTLAARFAGKASDKGNASMTLDLSAAKLVKDPFMAQIAFKDALSEELIGIKLIGSTDARLQAAHTDAGADSAGDKSLVLGLALSKDRIYVICSGAEYPADSLRRDTEELINKRIASEKKIATLGLKDELKYISIDRNKYIEDHMIEQYVIDPNRNTYDYDDLARDVLGMTVEGRDELIGKKDIFEMLGMVSFGQLSLFGEPETVPAKKKKTAAQADPDADREKAVKYMALNALIPLLADSRLSKRLKELELSALYEDIERPLIYALDDMEKTGIRVDRESLNEYAELLKGQLDVLTEEIHELAGEKFNINSPSQLGQILFEKLGIRGGKKTKTGYSTAADVLEKVSGEHEIVPKVLRYRALSKLYSTYAVGLSEYIGTDGRIHGTFNQTITATGRISSTEPNLQNIPVRTEEGKEIRRVFVPEEGFTFVDADYSQVELRILAALSEDPVLIDAYKNAVDIHTLTASQVFHVPADEVSPEMRRNAKAVNFGIVYGISAFGLGEGLSISRKEAEKYIEQYFESYPKVKEYLDKCVAEAREKGCVRTYFGRLRPIPELKSSNFMQRSFGERIAMNSPIQGTAADIMKIAMNRANEALKGMKSRLVLQVHDELLVETAPDELDEVKKIVKNCMEEAAELKVKLLAEIRDGKNWYECH